MKTASIAYGTVLVVAAAACGADAYFHLRGAQDDEVQLQPRAESARMTVDELRQAHKSAAMKSAVSVGAISLLAATRRRRGATRAAVAIGALGTAARRTWVGNARDGIIAVGAIRARKP